MNLLLPRFSEESNKIDGYYLVLIRFRMENMIYLANEQERNLPLQDTMLVVDLPIFLDTEDDSERELAELLERREDTKHRIEQFSEEGFEEWHEAANRVVRLFQEKLEDAWQKAVGNIEDKIELEYQSKLFWIYPSDLRQWLEYDDSFSFQLWKLRDHDAKDQRENDLRKKGYFRISNFL